MACCLPNSLSVTGIEPRFLLRDQTGDSLSEERMVIDAQDSNPVRNATHDLSLVHAGRTPNATPLRMRHRRQLQGR